MKTARNRSADQESNLLIRAAVMTSRCMRQTRLLVSRSA